MANTDDQMPEVVERAIDRDVPQSTKDNEPAWRVMTEDRIPVSRFLGSNWKHRLALGQKCKESVKEAWKESYRYYDADQMLHRRAGNDERPGNKVASMGESPSWAATENIVYSNTNAMISMIYAKNPKVEITASTSTREREVNGMEAVLNALIARRYAPGINLKPAAKDAVKRAQLSNNGILQIGWNFRDTPDFQVMEQIRELEEKMQKAKSEKQIQVYLGEYEALQRHFAVLDPPGPYVKRIDEYEFIVDPNSVDEQFDDAWWVMYPEYIQTDYLNARYGKIKGKTVQSVYKPTHVLTASSDTEDADEFKLFNTDYEDGKHYGFDDRDEYDRAKYTKCWWCWDKAERKVYLYADKSWKWPVWVFRDPYNLVEFFPFYRLQFVGNHKSPFTKGETSYYLDQQDEINEITTVRARALAMAKNIWLYDKEAIEDGFDLASILSKDELVCKAVTVPPTGEKKFFFPLVHPALELEGLLDTRRALEAADRISAVSNVMRGAEFKTNTTNQANDQYTSNTQTRLDERIDAIEDFVGALAYGLLQMAVQFLREEDVVTLVGPVMAETWRPMTPTELMRDFNMTIVGGSTVKPTSEAKRRETVQIAQILGQFEVPALAELVLRAIERSFDGFVVTKEDFENIRRQGQQSLETAGAGPGQPTPNQPGAPQGGQAEQLVQELVNNQGIPQEQAVTLVQQAMSRRQNTGEQ